jgi:hypothetical protein
LFTTVVSASKPLFVEPPSVVMLLAKEWMPSALCRSTGRRPRPWSSPDSSQLTFENRASFEVFVLDEVDDPAGVLEGDGIGPVLGALVLEADLEALVEERHHLQALDDRASGELERLEDRAVGPERDRGAVRP